LHFLQRMSFNSPLRNLFQIQRRDLSHHTLFSNVPQCHKFYLQLNRPSLIAGRQRRTSRSPNPKNVGSAEGVQHITFFVLKGALCILAILRRKRLAIQPVLGQSFSSRSRIRGRSWMIASMDFSERNGKRSFLRLVIGRIFVFVLYIERLSPAISDGAFRLHVNLAEDNRSDFFHCLEGEIHHSLSVCFICFQDNLVMQ
jgi:hypothetical protein